MDFFKNIILKKETLGNNKLIEDTTSIHIAFGIDANFTIGTGVLIYSILQHNNNNIVFNIFLLYLYFLLGLKLCIIDLLLVNYYIILLIIYYI